MSFSIRRWVPNGQCELCGRSVTHHLMGCPNEDEPEDEEIFEPEWEPDWGEDD